MKVESGMSSVLYGHASGATVNVVTRSGANRWHGDAWEYLRNNKLDARSFFLPVLGAFRWNQFGGAAGGPLAIPHLLSKERGWYIFGYYEGLRIRRASNFTGFVPTPAELQGNFAGLAPIFDPNTTTTDSSGRRQRQPFPGNQIPQRLLNPSTLLIATTLYPAPNLPPGLIPGANFLNTTPVSTDADQWSVRVDHQFGQRHSFFSRYSEARNPSRSVGLPSLPSHNLQRVTNVVVNDTITFNPTFLVTARFGLARSESQGGPAVTPGLAARAGTLEAYPPFYGDELIPPVSIPGYTGLSQERSIVGPLWQNQWSADSQKIRGAHTIEFGGNLVRTSIFVDNRTASTQFSPNQTSNFTGGTGQAFASFLLGLPESASRNAGSTLGDMSGNAYSLYIQDNWRATRTFTLNIGLRYDYARPLVIQSGLGTFIWETGEYVWDQTNPITGEAATIRPGGIPPDRNNFAPRAGIAWQLSPRTVVRSAFGIFYNTFGSNYVQTQQGARGNWPFAFPQAIAGLNQEIPNAIMPNPFPGPATGSRTPLGCQQCLNVVKETSRTSYVEEWTFSIQHQLARQWGVEAAYFGSHGVKLVGQLIDNIAVEPGPGPFRNRQRWPAFPPFIQNGYNAFPSWYHGVSLKLDKRFSRGLSFLASYTFSKNLNIVDNLSNASLGGAPTSNVTRFNIPFNKGPAGFDVPHILVASFVWEVPGRTRSRAVNAVIANWQLSGIASYYSGLPFMTFLSSDNENVGTVPGRSAQYPNLVGDPNDIAERTPFRWFNTAAFAAPPPFTRGNAGRNIMRTDSLQNLDAAVHKRWPFHESRYVELRGEFFNTFNHPSFGYPGTVLGTTQFGRVSNTRNSGRQVQAAVKIHF
jgi:hypothetical protein